jgi:hypothetical protein
MPHIMESRKGLAGTPVPTNLWGAHGSLVVSGGASTLELFAERGNASAISMEY